MGTSGVGSLVDLTVAEWPSSGAGIGTAGTGGSEMKIHGRCILRCILVVLKNNL